MENAENEPLVRQDNVARDATRIAVGSAMMLAGVSHWTFARKGFQAQVPEWVPFDKDFVVLASGVVEFGLGAALAGLPRHREPIGAALAAFFIAIFPGNLSQFTGHKDGVGLDSDRKRAVRLAFQPLMVAAAWWSTRTPRG